ncbi:putative esterase/lipase [Aspergillus saccharolyticus JOP 1030-1]|uniref:Putative esterase/lipase n=1 Tax=Aspergillus saccharolyticus JOP 1030-1 TaxID=1450539 RepID=A0A318ZMW1_9EURO|nr:putative esterase/lipase [Aspergillus saccharolyticus JOP 1030-1]PYH47824.1 putative esterase/lipase [Aspergillus saccharolyticus JOP 1030-1]
MFFLTYLYYKLLAVFLRRITVRKTPEASPDEVLQIDSRDGGRTIKVHLYRNASASTSKPTPVLVNFHGSGFVFPLHGSDDPYCRQMSRETDRTVLDVQYRLAPENPFPAALNDAEDVVRWVLAQPDKFDLSRVSLSGFSAGGNFVLAAAGNLFPPETFHSVIAVYPVVDIHTDAALKVPPDTSGKAIPLFMSRFFDACYTHGKYDTRDPRISPLYANPERFPSRVMIVTAACDNLAVEAETLAHKIAKAPGKDREVVQVRMQGCNHAFDKRALPGTVQWDAREKTYAMAGAMLSR